MQSAADDVHEILEAESSLGLSLGVNLFIGRELDQPDDCVILFDTPGMAPELTLGNDVGFYRPAIQVRVRNKSYINGYSLIFDIMKLLHGRGPETWNGMVYSAIVCVGDPMLLDWDPKGRARFICSFSLLRSEA